MGRKKLEGKICIITGAGSGIGLQAARDFVLEGATVYAADINPAGLQVLREKTEIAVAEKSGKNPVQRDSIKMEQLHTVVLDVTRRDETEKIADRVFTEQGRIDVLINNAGITADATLLKMTYEQFDRVIDVNLKGVFNMGKACAGYMAQQGSGSIINTSSIVGVSGNYGQSNYAASKAGVIGITKTWARELGRKGIRVNAVAPGFIQTEMIQSVPEKVISMLLERTPLGRLGTPEDISMLYQFLASDESSFITGQVIGIDGGLVL